MVSFTLTVKIVLPLGLSKTKIPFGQAVHLPAEQCPDPRHENQSISAPGLICSPHV